MAIKKCKPIGKAKGFEGCGNELSYTEKNGIKSYNSKYGMCMKCYAKWLYSTKEGEYILEKAKTIGKKKTQKEERAKYRKEKKEANISGAMRLADTYFSRYIRLKHSANGNCTCYTCGAIKPIKEVDNGHYMKREHKATRYDENNCRPQCKTCNGDTKHNGKQGEFRVNLSYEIGEEKVVEIEKLARTSIKANYSFYNGISEHYRNSLNELQKKLKVKYW